MSKFLLKYLKITLGTMFFAVGAVFFIDAHNLAAGGVTGISIILNKILPLPIGFYVFLINVPLLIIGLIKFGKEFLLGTVYATVMLSLNIFLCELLLDYLLSTGATWFKVENVILSALCGACFMSFGLGLVFKGGATTGGIDILVKLLRLKFRHLKMGRIFLITDVIIVVSSLPVVGWSIEVILYALLAMVVTNYLFDLFLYGTDGAKLVYIISDNSHAIAERIIKEIDISATFLEGVGAYTQKRKEVLMCVIKKQLFPKLKDVVAEEDETAFFIISSASEIFGEGYKTSIKEEK